MTALIPARWVRTAPNLLTRRLLLSFREPSAVLRVPRVSGPSFVGLPQRAANWLTPPRIPSLLGADVRRVRSPAGPELGDAHICLAEQGAQSGDGKPDDGVGIAVDLADERPAVAVDREGAGALERLAGGDVGLDFLGAHLHEVHLGRGHRAQGGAG